MWLRKILIAVAVSVPLVWTPAPASAQEHGLVQAASSTEHANDVEGWTHKATPKGQKGLPSGVAQRFEGSDVLPPGMSRTRELPSTDAVPEPEPDGGSDTGDDTCSTEIVMVGTDLYVQDCNGNLFPLFP